MRETGVAQPGIARGPGDDRGDEDALLRLLVAATPR
jgi:hypothetical protein